MREKNLPGLKCLRLEGAGYNPSIVFDFAWPTLTHLHIAVQGSTKGLEDFYSSSRPSAASLFPNLQAMTLNCDLPEHFIPNLFSEAWNNMSSLDLEFWHIFHWNELEQVYLANKLPKLDQLSINVGCGIIGEHCTSCVLVNSLLPKLGGVNLHMLRIGCFTGNNMSVLMKGSFPFLNTLVVRDGCLVPEDLVSLDRVHAEGRLPQLRHLDISYNNGIIGKLYRLFGPKNCRNVLLSLRVNQSFKPENRDDHNADLNDLFSQAERGCLIALQELSFSVYRADWFTERTRAFWPSLKCLTVSSEINNSDDFLLPLIEMVEENMLPNLETVYFYAKCSVQSLWRLRQRGIHLCR